MASVLASSETQGRSVGPGEKARRKFSSTSWKALGTDSHRTISKRSSEWWFLIRHKKCFVLLCPIGEQFLLSSLALGDLQLGDLIINGQLLLPSITGRWNLLKCAFWEIHEWQSAKDIRVYLSWIFQYTSREVCALNISGFYGVMITY